MFLGILLKALEEIVHYQTYSFLLVVLPGFSISSPLSSETNNSKDYIFSGDDGDVKSYKVLYVNLL